MPTPAATNVPPGAYDPDTPLPAPKGLANPYELGFGTVCGICAGVFIKKGLKAAAFLLGGVFVLLQVCIIYISLGIILMIFMAVFQLSALDSSGLEFCRGSFQTSILHYRREWTISTTDCPKLLYVDSQLCDGRLSTSSILPGWIGAGTANWLTFDTHTRDS